MGTQDACALLVERDVEIEVERRRCWWFYSEDGQWMLDTFGGAWKLMWEYRMKMTCGIPLEATLAVDGRAPSGELSFLMGRI
jgi:hypothetical protein